MEQALFITFEGIEGCGKTTQVKRLSSRLTLLKIAHVLTLEPGGTPVGRRIRQVLLDSGNRNLSLLAELLLYAADRAQHVEEVVRPALRQGKWVVCDRFFDATVAYQGHARGQDMALIGLLNQKACGGILPDFTFLLDCPVQVGLERAFRRNMEDLTLKQDRFERENEGFHLAVREGYLILAKENPERFVVVNASLSEDEMEEQIWRHLGVRIPKGAD
ncbi:MAG: dTMP kinase [Deltaproteobacteria bacterium]